VSISTDLDTDVERRLFSLRGTCNAGLACTVTARGG
jgi:hypothetical protein